MKAGGDDALKDLEQASHSNKMTPAPNSRADRSLPADGDRDACRCAVTRRIASEMKAFPSTLSDVPDLVSGQSSLVGSTMPGIASAEFGTGEEGEISDYLGNEGVACWVFGLGSFNRIAAKKAAMTRARRSSPDGR